MKQKQQRRIPTAAPSPQLAKNKKTVSLMGTRFFMLCFFFASNNELAIVVTAVTANAMRQIVFSAMRTLYHAGHFELPNVGTSLVSSCLGCFSLRYSHDYTSLGSIGRMFTVYYNIPIPIYQVVFVILRVLDQFLFLLVPLPLPRSHSFPQKACVRSGDRGPGSRGNRAGT